MNTNIISVALTLFIAVFWCVTGCSGDGRNTGTPNTSPPTDMVVIGNSLTFVGQSPSTGWGMAASAANKDFSHLVAASMALPLTSANNFSALEKTPVSSAGNIPAMALQVKATTLAVIELGDNVKLSDLPDFTVQYGNLLNAVKQAQVLICTSTWWQDDAKDAMIQAACTAHGGHYVFIGDIRTDPASQDSLGVQFSDPGVNAHPHDWSMVKISERIVAAAR